MPHSVVYVSERQMERVMFCLCVVCVAETHEVKSEVHVTRVKWIIGRQSEGSLIRGFDNLVLTLTVTVTVTLTLGLSIVRT